MFTTPGPLDFVAIAREALELWERKGIFARLVEKNRGGPVFSFLAERTSGQTGLSRSRRTARYEPQRSASAAAATPSRPTIEPEGRLGGSGLASR